MRSAHHHRTRWPTAHAAEVQTTDYTPPITRSLVQERATRSVRHELLPKRSQDRKARTVESTFEHRHHSKAKGPCEHRCQRDAQKQLPVTLVLTQLPTFANLEDEVGVGQEGAKPGGEVDRWHTQESGW